MALVDSVADFVMKTLPHDTSDADVVATLRKKHPGELLELYINWQGRLIAAQSRQVMRSAEFDKNPVAAERSSIVAEIIRDIERGLELTKYLSRRVRIGFKLSDRPQKKNLRQLQHLDMLLNEWGIHHFHLSTNVESDGFVERDDPLLFIMFRANKAYLLDIGTHKMFEDDKLAEIAIVNWPEDQLFLELKGIDGPREGNPYTPEDRKKLRSAGISSFITIGGRAFSPAGGISSAGTSVQTSMRTNHIMRTLRLFEEGVLSDPSKILAHIRQHGGRPNNIPEFEFSIFPEGFGVVEKTSGTGVLLGK